MLYAGSDDGVYRIEGAAGAGPTAATQVLAGGRTLRLTTLSGLDGLFAATREGLYHSPDGESWTDCAVPREAVFSVGASSGGDRLYAGTFPAHVYVLEGFDPAVPPTEADWRELDGFRDLPSREEWYTPRHDGAQVRDVHVPEADPDCVVAGVEVGGVHVSEDRGRTWVERREGVHDDVHHLQALDAETFVAATGDGLYRSTDAGRSWTELSTDVDQHYVREALAHDGTIYAGLAHGPSPTWNEETNHGLYVSRDGANVEPVETPRPDELAIGWTVTDEGVLAATHRGTLLRVDVGANAVEVAGSVPVPGDVLGRYLPLEWVAE